MCNREEILADRILELIQQYCIEDGQLNLDRAKGIIVGCITAEREESYCGTHMPIMFH